MGGNSKRELRMGRWGDNRDLQCFAQCPPQVTLLPSLSACSTPCTSCPYEQPQVASAVSPAPELTPEATAAGLQLPGQARCVAGLQRTDPYGIWDFALDFCLDFCLERKRLVLRNRPGVLFFFERRGCMGLGTGRVWGWS